MDWYLSLGGSPTYQAGLLDWALLLGLDAYHIISTYLIISFSLNMVVRCLSMISVNGYFFFFLINKKQIYKHTKTRGREQKNPGIHGSCTKGHLSTNSNKTKNPPKNYLLPNHVKKSTTECVLSTLCRIAQDHKLVTKLALIL